MLRREEWYTSLYITFIKQGCRDVSMQNYVQIERQEIDNIRMAGNR